MTRPFSFGRQQNSISHYNTKRFNHSLFSMDPSASTCLPTSCQLDHAPKQAPESEKLASLSKDQHGWRKIVRNFTPSWFSVNMGTGIVSILLHNLPYNGVWLYYISVIIFALNVGLFVTFLLLSILRYSIWPEIWMKMIRHPVQSLFIGTFPMGLATIINMTVFVCVPAWGGWVTTLVSDIVYMKTSGD